jgi:hypothetical protein
MKKTRFTNAVSPPRFRRHAMFPFSLALAAILLLANRVEATTITIDPGAVGSSLSKDFHFFELSGTAFEGQSLSVDIFFADNKFAVAESVHVALYIAQSGSIGTWPTAIPSLTGYLLDTTGAPLSVPVSFGNTGRGPAIIWPGWPYYLPDGTQYRPAYTSHSGTLWGTPINITPSGYSIDPLVFSGIHFDITLPDSPVDTIIGSRLSLSNFAFPIYISPDPLPEFVVRTPVPDSSSSFLLLGCALAALGSLRKKLMP